MRRRKSKKERIALLILCAALTLLAAACSLFEFVLGGELDSQRAAERWQGEADMEFRQLSCFVPVDEKLSLNQIYQFRSDMMKRLHEAALDADSEQTLFVDAWSCTGKALASTDLGKGDANVIAVGGNFFHFRCRFHHFVAIIDQIFHNDIEHKGLAFMNQQDFFLHSGLPSPSFLIASLCFLTSPQ